MAAALPSPPAPDDVVPWAVLADELLVALARLGPEAPPRSELLRRCRGPNARLVRRLAARSHLQDADRQDAEQEAVLWTLDAVAHFDPAGQGPGGERRFRTFMYRVVTARFIDYLRRVRCRERHLHLHGEATAPPPVNPAVRPGQGDELDRAEERACLGHALDRLAPPARRLWDLLAAGISLRSAAADLGISYDMAKRQRRELLTHLRVALAN